MIDTTNFDDTSKTIYKKTAYKTIALQKFRNRLKF